MTNLAWVAGRDQVAHAQARGLSRTLCGRPLVIARWAWPATVSCADCSARAGVLPMARQR
jgi:hypothetical protein